MKILAIDYGLKKIWIAVWDMDFKIPFPKKVIFSSKELFFYIEKENFDILVLWIPKVNEWEDSKQFDICNKFYLYLKSKYKNKKIELIDERMTTKIAKQKLLSAWISEKKWKFIEDSISAQIILETYFNLLENN